MRLRTPINLNYYPEVLKDKMEEMKKRLQVEPIKAIMNPYLTTGDFNVRTGK
jgi:hypothetical protein